MTEECVVDIDSRVRWNSRTRVEWAVLTMLEDPLAAIGDGSQDWWPIINLANKTWTSWKKLKGTYLKYSHLLKRPPFDFLLQNFCNQIWFLNMLLNKDPVSGFQVQQQEDSSSQASLTFCVPWRRRSSFFALLNVWTSIFSSPDHFKLWKNNGLNQ